MAEKPALRMKSKVEIVYRGVKEAILDNALPPGTKLPEDSVGEGFGVSRTIARSALSQLAVEGLVDMQHNRRAMVASPSLDEARGVFAVRRGLERMAAEMLAANFTSAQAGILSAHVDRELSVREKDTAASVRLAGEFHHLIAEMTGNALLQRYLSEVISRCSLILAIYGRPHSSDCAVNEHRQLIQALQQHDAPTAVQLMDDHLGAVVQRALLEPSAQREHDLKGILATYAKPVKEQ